jgi:hypothetical protein
MHSCTLFTCRILVRRLHTLAKGTDVCVSLSLSRWDISWWYSGIEVGSDTLARLCRMKQELFFSLSLRIKADERELPDAWPELVAAVRARDVPVYLVAIISAFSS